MRPLLAAFVALALAAVPLASANDCDPEVTLETPAGTFYVDNDACQLDGCLFSLWIYQESDGQPGCTGDTILF